MKERRLELSENEKRVMALPDNVKVYLGLNNAIIQSGLSLEAEIKLKMERFNVLMQMLPEERQAMGKYLEWRNRQLLKERGKC